MIGVPSHLGNRINIFRIISARKYVYLFLIQKVVLKFFPLHPLKGLECVCMHM